MGRMKEEKEKTWIVPTNRTIYQWSKWCKENIPRKGKDNISEEGQGLLEDRDRWCDKTTLLKEWYESRKRKRISEDGSFMSHQKGSIMSAYTTDWFLREKVDREKLGEWMKMTSVRSQDQGRMLQVTSHNFPSNSWIHKITKEKESNKCDLYKTLF